MLCDRRVVCQKNNKSCFGLLQSDFTTANKQKKNDTHFAYLAKKSETTNQGSKVIAKKKTVLRRQLTVIFPKSAGAFSLLGISFKESNIQSLIYSI